MQRFCTFGTQFEREYLMNQTRSGQTAYPLTHLIVLVLLPWIFAVLMLVRIPLFVFLAVVVKKCLIGKYKPGEC